MAPVATDLLRNASLASQGWVDKVLSLAKRRHVRMRGEVLTGVGSVADALMTCANRRKVDPIVVGGRDAGTLKKLVLGTVPSALMDNAKIPVLVVK
jgi:nucleotide-binding universal stress UspA family protein